MEIEAARSMSGVHAVLTGKDIVQHVKPLRVGGSAVLRPVKLYPLAVDKIRYFGEPLAVVVADNRYLAEDAAEDDLGGLRFVAGSHRPGSGDGAGGATGS